MMYLTIFAPEGTAMQKDPTVNRVSADLEGQECRVARAAKTDVPCTLIVIRDSEAMLPT
jgi:hypothetical protein